MSVTSRLKSQILHRKATWLSFSLTYSTIFQNLRTLGQHFPKQPWELRRHPGWKIDPRKGWTMNLKVKETLSEWGENFVRTFAVSDGILMQWNKTRWTREEIPAQIGLNFRLSIYRLSSVFKVKFFLWEKVNLSVKCVSIHSWTPQIDFLFTKNLVFAQSMHTISWPSRCTMTMQKSLAWPSILMLHSGNISMRWLSKKRAA